MTAIQNFDFKYTAVFDKEVIGFIISKSYRQ
jgi:hypothetical protein